MANGADEGNPVRGGTRFRPERCYETTLANSERERVYGKHRYDALGDRHQSSALVSGSDVICGSRDFDAIQGGWQAGYCDAEEDAPERKNQQ